MSQDNKPNLAGWAALITAIASLITAIGFPVLFPDLVKRFLPPVLPFKINAQPTSVGSEWQRYSYKCPSDAKLIGTWGQTSNFDITLCSVKGLDYFNQGAYYIGTDKKTGKSITIYSNNGKFVNGKYEYKFEDYNSFNTCSLQVLENGKVILNERFEEWMFMTPPCMVYKN
jgi:hypothetical protein